MSQRTASSQQLDRWLARGPALAALVGPAGRGKSTFLKAWSRQVDAEVVFVSTSRRRGTARQDAMLNQLYAGLESALPSMRRAGERPHGVREIQQDIALMFREGRPDAARPFLVVLDGAQEAADWGFETLSGLFAEIGPGVRVVVSATSDEGLQGSGWGRLGAQMVDLAPLEAGEVADAVRGRLGTVADDTVAQIVRMSAGEPVVLEALLAPIGSRLGAAASLADAAPGVVGSLEWLIASRSAGYARALKWLACALSPVPAAELRAIAGEAVEPFDWDDRSDPIVALDEGGVSLRHFAWAEAILARVGDAERREMHGRFAAHGLSVFASVASGKRAPQKVSNHVRAGLRIHLDRASADLATRLTLVSNDWLNVWLPRPEATSAFLADVDATGAFVRERLVVPSLAPQRAALLVARVRCLLVTSSLRAMIAADENRRVLAAEAALEGDEEGELRLDLPPVGEDPFDAGRPIGDAGARARALSHLASALEEPARGEVLGWALQAARDETADPAALSELVDFLPAGAQTSVARQAVERLRGARGEDRCARVRIARHLPRHEAVELVRGSLEELAEQAEWDELPTLSQVVAELEPAVVRAAWDWAENLETSHRHVALSRLCSGLPAAERDAGARAALEATLSTSSDDYLPSDGCFSLCHLAPSAPSSSLDDLARACAMAHSFRLPVVRAVAARAADLGRFDEARSLIATLAGPQEQLKARCTLVAHLPRQARVAEWRQLTAELCNAEGVRHLVETNAPAWVAALGGAPVLELARELGATPETFITVAKASPAFAEGIVAELLQAANASPDEEWLFTMAPLAFAMKEADALAFCARLLEGLAWKPRPDLLSDWTKDDLGRLAPLLRKAGGSDAVLGVARTIVEVAQWLP